MSPPNLPKVHSFLLLPSLTLALLAFVVETRAQIPEPLLYFNFEDGGGTTLNDGSPNEHNGTISRGVTFVTGAPDGPTPTGGGRFLNGLVQVSTIDVPSQISHRDSNPDGSYTLAAWMKPDADSIGGDHFFWGQTSQGIHNGLRGSGTLHTAHWGSDFNANTVLTADQWIHAVWTYDGPTDTANIYLNGVIDGGPFVQLGPNGSGNLILGGRNGGSENFNGCVDEVAVWTEVLSEEVIQQLADGTPILEQEDADADGLPDAYEIRIAGNLTDLNGMADGPGPGAGTGDLDGDGLSDLREFEVTRTDPTKADSDEDGLPDGVETNTGTFVDASDTGTDPNNDDSDEDGLLDGVETNSGILVDENDTGTDPNNPDTDDDSHLDGAEVAGGFDPHDPDSRPGIPQPFLYFNFEEGGGTELEDLSASEFIGTIERGVTFVEGAPDGSSPGTGARFDNGLVQVSGLDVPSELAHRDSNPDGSYTLACWMKPDAISIGGDRFFWGQTSQGIHNGLRGSGTLHTAHWGSDFNAQTVLTADEWIHATWTYDGPTDTAYLYLNGVQDGGPFGQLGPNGSGNLILGGRDGGSQNFIGCIDDVAVWQEVLSIGAIGELAAGAPIVPDPDSDGDGMTDRWEINFLGEGAEQDDGTTNPDFGPDGDPDSDGLSNLEEFNARTDPKNDDTDGDGLKDGVESGTGTFVSESDTGTSPRRPDSDSDGLQDGQELALGTDPNNPDTDGDGFSDGAEVNLGSNPTSASSTPNAWSVELIAYWPQDGDHDNKWIVEVDDYHGTVEGPDIPFNDGIFDQAAHLDGSHNIIIGGDENVFDRAGQSITVSAWFTADAITKGWQCLVAKGEGNGWRMHRRGGDNPPQMAWTGGNGDTPAHNTPITVDGETWHHVVGVTDSETQTQILYMDGVELSRSSGATLQNRANPMKIGQNPDTGDRRWQGRIDDVAVWGRPLSADEVAALYANGLDGTSLGALIFGSPTFFFDVQREGDQLLLTWESQDGQLYNVRSTDDLSEGEGDALTWAIHDGHENIAADPPFNTLLLDISPEMENCFFAIEAFPAPPESILADDFESGQGDWTVGSDGDAGTAWELGTPTSGPGAANSGDNCFATNLDGDYELNAEVWLRSPAIDLTTAGAATLNFMEFRDIEAGFDFGTIRVLDAADDSEIAILDDAIDGVSVDWEPYKKSLPAEALGKVIVIEFRFTSDDIQNFAGWYIDDINVTVP